MCKEVANNFGRPDQIIMNPVAFSMFKTLMLGVDEAKYGEHGAKLVCLLRKLKVNVDDAPSKYSDRS